MTTPVVVDRGSRYAELGRDLLDGLPTGRDDFGDLPVGELSPPFPIGESDRWLDVVQMSPRFSRHREVDDVSVDSEAAPDRGDAFSSTCALPSLYDLGVGEHSHMVRFARSRSCSSPSAHGFVNSIRLVCSVVEMLRTTARRIVATVTGDSGKSARCQKEDDTCRIRGERLRSPWWCPLEVSVVLALNGSTGSLPLPAGVLIIDDLDLRPQSAPQRIEEKFRAFVHTDEGPHFGVVIHGSRMTGRKLARWAYRNYACVISVTSLQCFACRGGG